MFIKPFKVKTNSRLKGSERKKLRTEILQSFPQLRDDDVQQIIPNNETASVMKVHTHGNDLVLIYFAEKIPIIFEYENVLYPTVYLLWRFPVMLFCFTTWPEVFPKIVGGADLMLPGVVLQGEYGPKSFGNLQKGDRVAVNLTTNRAPVAVGTAYRSSSDMFYSGKRGKGVQILHFVGDVLWSHGTKASVPELGPPRGMQADLENDSETVEELISKVDNVNLEYADNKIGSYNEENNPYITEDSVSDEIVDNTDTIVSKALDVAAVNGDPREKMDDLLMYCFLKSLKTTAKKEEYPMLVSKFYKLHLLPACPINTTLDIKKTSYKKLSNFLTEMSSLEIIEVQEITKGVQSIMSVYWSHPKLKEFVYSEGSNIGSDPDKLDVNVSSSPEIKEMYVVTAAVVPLMRQFGYSKGSSLPVNIIRNCLTDYVNEQKLQDISDRRIVNMDDMLKKVLDTNDLSLSWKDLIVKLLSRMTESYQISFSGKNPVVKKGKLEPITIHTARRTGNKKVTLVDNLQLYGVTLTDFASECQHGVAASTSINSVPGKKSPQVMVQGNQAAFIEKLLTERYEIPKRYIRLCN